MRAPILAACEFLIAGRNGSCQWGAGCRHPLHASEQAARSCRQGPTPVICWPQAAVMEIRRGGACPRYLSLVSMYTLLMEVWPGRRLLFSSPGRAEDRRMRPSPLPQYPACTARVTSYCRALQAGQEKIRTCCLEH